MPELIDRQEALKKMCGDCKSGYDGHCPHPLGMCHEYESILQAPTIESEPVRHGRMIEGRYPNENKCSECGQVFRDDIGFITKRNARKNGSASRQAMRSEDML